MENLKNSGHFMKKTNTFFRFFQKDTFKYQRDVWKNIDGHVHRIIFEGKYSTTHLTNEWS